MPGNDETSFTKEECSRDAHVRWICGNTRRDKMRNNDIFVKLVVVPIKEKM